MREINDAYRVLSNPDKRFEYDQVLKREREWVKERERQEQAKRQNEEDAKRHRAEERLRREHEERVRKVREEEEIKRREEEQIRSELEDQLRKELAEKERKLWEEEAQRQREERARGEFGGGAQNQYAREAQNRWKNPFAKNTSIEEVGKKSADNKSYKEILCVKCKTTLESGIRKCPNCGRNQYPGKSKFLTFIIAIIAGAFGAHRFYLVDSRGWFFIIAWVAYLALMADIAPQYSITYLFIFLTLFGTIDALRLIMIEGTVWNKRISYYECSIKEMVKRVLYSFVVIWSLMFSYIAIEKYINRDNYSAHMNIENSLDNKDYEKALEIATQLANNGDAKGQHILGTLYFEGTGVKQDYEQAFLWLRRAASHGMPLAKVHLARSYIQGLGVKQDIGEAYKLIKQAADSGLPIAKWALKTAYFERDGNELKVNKEKTIKRMKESAKEGVTEAQFYVGLHYEN